MPKKKSYKQVKSDVESVKGYVLLSQEYSGTHKKLEILCPNGHRFFMSYNQFYNTKDRCPNCTERNLEKRQSNARNFIESLNYSLLDTYRSNSQKLKLMCEHGHVFSYSLSQLQRGSRCKKCNVKEKSINKYIKVKGYIESIEGFALMSEKYTGYHNADLVIKCSKGHIFTASYDYMVHSETKCPKCSKENVSEKHRISIEKVYNLIKEKNFTFVKLIDEYKNNTSNFLLECPNGHQFTSNRGKLKQGCGCPICNKGVRLDGNSVYKEFLYHDFTPLFEPNEYKRAKQKLPYVCNKHKDEIQYVTYDSLKHHTHSCKFCFRESRKKITSWEYKYKSIENYLRAQLEIWIMDTMKYCNYTCVITGKINKLVVHHFFGFNLIVKQAFTNTKIPVKVEFFDYSKEEIKLLTEEVSNLHKIYGLGVLIKTELHKLFHSEYGYGFNTCAQFKEFVARLEQGDFSKFLNDNDLDLNINYEVLNKLLNK